MRGYRLYYWLRSGMLGPGRALSVLHRNCCIMYTPDTMLLFAFLVLLGGCATEEQSAYDLEHQADVRIVFLGDSITEAGALPGGYVMLVEDSLQATFPNRSITVIGAGISGNKVPDLEARLNTDVLEKEPTHVVIYIGINDVWHHFEFDHTTGTEPDIYETGLRNLIASIQGVGATVLLCTPSVIGEDPGSDAPVNQRLMQYASISRQIAESSGAHLCDLRTTFEEYLQEHNTNKRYEGILTSDGVHLNEAGNRFVAAFMMQHLRAVLEL